MSIQLLILAVVGLLIYALTDGKKAEIGRILFFAALIGMCMGAAPHMRLLQ